MGRPSFQKDGIKMSKPTPESKMLHELKRKAVRKQKRFEALQVKILKTKEKKIERR